MSPGTLWIEKMDLTDQSVLGNGFSCRFACLQILVDSCGHFAPFGDGPDDQRGDTPIVSHSSFPINRLGFKAPLA